MAERVWASDPNVKRQPAERAKELRRERIEIEGRRFRKAGLGMGFQRAAGNVFHDDVTEVLGNDGIVNLDNVRVIELADQRGFVEEQAAVELTFFRVAQDVRRGDLDRDGPLGKWVTAEVDGAGRTVAEFSDQFVFAELFHQFAIIGAITAAGDGCGRAGSPP